MQRFGGMMQNFRADAKTCAPASASMPEMTVNLAPDAAILAVSVFIFTLLWGLGLRLWICVVLFLLPCPVFLASLLCRRKVPKEQ